MAPYMASAMKSPWAKFRRPPTLKTSVIDRAIRA
jgi:hypothetical protein